METEREFLINNSFGFISYSVIELHSEIFINSISLSESKVEIDLTSKYQILANTSPSTADIDTLIYASDDERVAIVDEGGLITPIGNGTATIYVYSPDRQVSTSMAVVVKEKVELTDIAVSIENSQISIGETKQIKVNFAPNNSTQKLVEYSSSDLSTATVDKLGNIRRCHRERVK